MTVKGEVKGIIRGEFLLCFTRLGWNGQAMAIRRWGILMPPVVSLLSLW